MSKSTVARAIRLVVVVCYALSSSSWAQYNLPRPDMEILDRYLDRADACMSRAEWDELSLAGSGAVMAQWDSDALILLEAGIDCGALREAADAEVRKSIEGRLSTWLVERFFGDLDSVDVSAIASSAMDSRLRGVFEVDADGRIAIDGSGSPIRRELGGDEAFARELDDWRDSMDALTDGAIAEWYVGATAAFGELLSSLSPEQRTALESSGDVRLSGLRESQLRQIDALMRIEESNYRYQRLNDRYSLRRKSDSMSAGSLVESLIGETQAKTAAGIAELSAGLDLDVGEISLDGEVIDGDDWQERFRAELRKGLDLWNGASEELLMRRIEWEQRAGENLASGIDSWNDARLALQERQREWLSDFRGVREQGEARFDREFADLERARGLALAELDASIAASNGSLSERVEATVGMLAQSIEMMKTARDSMGYWIARIPGNEEFTIDSVSWDADEMRARLEERRPDGGPDTPAGAAFEQATYWLNTVYESYSDLARDLNEELADTWGLVVFGDEEARSGDSAIDPVAVLNGNGWESVYLDSWQVELLKARAVKAYWERELEVAQAVHEYSIDTSYTRPTEEETLVDYEKSYGDYRAALAEYQGAVSALEAVDGALFENQARMADIRERLEIKNGELLAAKDEYSRLLVMSELNTADYYSGRFRDYYEGLLRLRGLLPGEESALSDALSAVTEASSDLEAESFLESSSRAVHDLIHGGDTADETQVGIIELKRRHDARSAFAIRPEALDDVQSFKEYIGDSLALRPGDGWYSVLIEAFEANLETPGKVDSLICLLDTAARTLTLESQGDLERSMAYLRLLMAGTGEAARDAAVELAGVGISVPGPLDSIADSLSLLERAEGISVTVILQERLELELAALSRFAGAGCSMEAPENHDSPEVTLAWVFGELAGERGIADVEAYTGETIASLTILRDALMGLDGPLVERRAALRPLASSDPLIAAYLDGGSVFADGIVDYAKPRLASCAYSRAVTGSTAGFKTFVDLSPGYREELRVGAVDAVVGWIRDNGLGDMEGSSLILVDPVALWDGFGPEGLGDVLDRIDYLERGMDSLLINESIPEYLRTVMADWLSGVSSLFMLRGIDAFGAGEAEGRLDDLNAEAIAGRNALNVCNESAALMYDGAASVEIRAASLLRLTVSGMGVPASIRDGTLDALGDSLARYRELAGGESAEDVSGLFDAWLDDIGAWAGSAARDTLRDFRSPIVSRAEAAIERGLARVAGIDGDGSIALKLRILSGDFSDGDLSGLDPEVAQDIGRFASVINAVGEYRRFLDGDFVEYARSCPELSDDNLRIDALCLYLSGSFDDSVFSRECDTLAGYLDDRCDRLGGTVLNAFSAYLARDLALHCAMIDADARSAERRYLAAHDFVRLSYDSIGSYREYLGDETIVIDEANGVDWEDVAYGESREVDRLCPETGDSLVHGSRSSINDGLEQASRVAMSGRALRSLFAAWIEDASVDSVQSYLGQYARLAECDPVADPDVGLLGEFATRESGYATARAHRAALDAYSSILARQDALVEGMRQDGRAVSAFRDSATDRALSLTSEAKAEIQRLEGDLDSLEIEWDLCINARVPDLAPAYYSSAGYIQLDTEYRRLFDEASVAFGNLEASKQEYRIAGAIRDYAATPYVFDNPEYLEGTRESAMRADAALSALEGVRWQREAHVGFDEGDIVYKGLKEVYERAYRARLAALQAMEMLDRETMIAREAYERSRQEYNETLAELSTIRFGEADDEADKEAAIRERIEGLSEGRRAVLRGLRISDEGAISFSGDGDVSVGEIVRYFETPKDGMPSGFERDLAEWIGAHGGSDCFAEWIDALSWEELRGLGCLNLEDYLLLYPPIEKVDRGYGCYSKETPEEIDCRYDAYLNAIARPNTLLDYKGTSKDSSIVKAVHLMGSYKYRTMTKLIGQCEESYAECKNDRDYAFFKLICLLDAVELGNNSSDSWMNSNFAFEYYEYAESKCDRYEGKAILPWVESEWRDAEKESRAQKNLAKSRMHDNQLGLMDAHARIAERLAAVREKKTAYDALSPGSGRGTVTASDAVDAIIAAAGRGGDDALSDVTRTAGGAASGYRAVLRDLLEGVDGTGPIIADTALDYLEAVSFRYDDMAAAISSDLDEYLFAERQGMEGRGLSIAQEVLEEEYRNAYSAFMDTGELSDLNRAIRSAFARPVFDRGDDYLLTYSLFGGILEDLNNERTGLRTIGQDEILDNMRVMLESMSEHKLSLVRDVREVDWDIKRMEIERAASIFSSQLDEILTCGTDEWERAGRLLIEKSDAWGKSFQADYEAKQDEWDRHYLDLVGLKDDWVVDMTARAVDIGNQRALGQIVDETRDGILASGSFIVSDLIEAPDTQALLSEFLDMGQVSGLLQAASALNRRIGEIEHVAFQSLRQRDYTSGETLNRIRRYHSEEDEELQARLSFIQYDQAVKTLENAHEEVEESLETANRKTWVGFRNLLIQDGFIQKGQNFIKETIVGATLWENLYEDHVIKGYEFFVAAIRDFTRDMISPEAINLASVGADGIQVLLDKAMGAVSAEYERLFGKKDESGNYVNAVYTEQYAVGKGKAGSRAIAGSEYGEYLETIREMNQEHKAEYDKKRRVVLGNIGAFTEWVGDAPVFREGADPGRDIGDYRKNVLFEGTGQTERIMGMFLQHKMIEGVGKSEANQPFYNKKIWDDRNGGMEAPSIRSVTDIAVSIAVSVFSGPQTGMLLMAAFNMIDDAVFTVLDMANGVEVGDALEGFGKKAMTCVASSAISVGFNGGCLAGGTKIAGIAQSSGLSGSVIGGAMLKGTEIAATNGATSAINAFSIKSALSGRDSFDEKGFSRGVIGNDAMARVASGVAGTLVSAGISERTGRVDYSGFSREHMKGISAVSDAAGGLVSTGVTWGMTGGATVNLLNTSMFHGLGLADRGGRAVNTGLLELRIGSGGARAAVGRSGTDLNLGKIASSMRGLGALYNNERIADYCAESGIDAGVAMRALFSYGDRSGKSLYNELVSGGATLEVDGSLDGQASTRAGADGSRSIGVRTLGNDLISGINAAIVLQHEAYRDGVVDAGQDAETRKAVEGHARMATRILEDGLYTEAIMSNASVLIDMAAYSGSSGSFGSYVDEAYDSSGDFWRIKLDGSIVDDGKNYVSREIIDASGRLVAEKIEGSEFSGSRAAALARVIGFGNVMGMLGGSVDALSDVPPEVIASVAGCSLETAQRMRMNPSLAPALMADGSDSRARILGEMLLYSSGSYFSDTNNRWVSGSLRIPGLGKNDSLGVVRNSDGSYEFFAAGMVWDRDDDAFDTWKDGVASSDYDVRDNTDVSIWKRNLFTGETETSVLDGAWTSVDKMSGNIVTVKGHTYQGNTIVSEYFKMHLKEYTGSKDYGVDRVGVLTDAQLLNGDSLNKSGTTPHDSVPWYMHPFSQNAGSEGCIGALSDINVSMTDWNRVIIPNSGAWYIDQLLDVVKSYQLYDGYEYNMHLTGRYRP